MACYDPNSLTASGTGELSVHLKPSSGLTAGVDGIYIDYANTGCESGLHLTGGKLSTLQTPKLDGFKENSATFPGYNPLPVGIGGTITAVHSGNITFTNTSCYTVLYFAVQDHLINVEVTPNSEWHGFAQLLINGVVATNNDFKLRQRSGGPQIVGQQFVYQRTDFQYVAPGATITFGCQQRHYAVAGVCELMAGYSKIQGFGFAMPLL